MLYLLPNLLSLDQDPATVFSKEVWSAVSSIEGLIAESEREAYRFLRRFMPREKMTHTILLLNEHASNISSLCDEMEKKKVWGLISDAGLPCLADPGASLVLAMRKKKKSVKAVGVFSSITKALILSGLSGQAFTFHGYLPKEQGEREQKILSWKKEREQITHIFMEAPYRSGKLFHSLLTLLPSNSYLSVAQNLSSANEWVQTFLVREWKDHSIESKAPTIFLTSM